MQKIEKNTTTEDLLNTLVALDYLCGKITDEGFSISKNGVSVNLKKMSSGNILFLAFFKTRESIDEYESLKKINSINHKLSSGTLCLTDDFITYSFTLVSPIGMGVKSFDNFINYHMFLVSYMTDKLGLSEIIQ